MGFTVNPEELPKISSYDNNQTVQSKDQSSCEHLLTKSQTQIQIIGIVIQDSSLAY